MDNTLDVQRFDELGEMMDNLFVGHGVHPESDYIRVDQKPAGRSAGSMNACVCWLGAVTPPQA